MEISVENERFIDLPIFRLFSGDFHEIVGHFRIGKPGSTALI